MQANKKKFWQFRNLASEPDSAELLLYGTIADTSWFDDEVSPRQFAEDLAELGAVQNITVRINSGGGDVFAAQAIGNYLEQHAATVTAKIDGICASAATIVACHCDRVEAPEDCEYMIHLPEVGVCDYLDENELRKLAGALATIKENLTALYVKKTGMSDADIEAMIEAETWMTGREAKEKGFVDELIAGGPPTVVENRSGVLFVNSISTGRLFAAAPKSVQDGVSRNVKTSPAEPQGDNSHKEGKTMELKNMDDLRREAPELANQIEQDAANARSEGEKAALDAERKRLKEIDEVADLFDPALVNEAKYGENPCDAKDLAFRAALAAKKQGSAFLAAMQDDAKNGGANGVPGAEPPATKAEENTPTAQAAAGKAAAAAYKDRMKQKEVR